MMMKRMNTNAPQQMSTNSHLYNVTLGSESSSEPPGMELDGEGTDLIVTVLMTEGVFDSDVVLLDPGLAFDAVAFVAVVAIVVCGATLIDIVPETFSIINVLNIPVGMLRGGAFKEQHGRYGQRKLASALAHSLSPWVRSSLCLDEWSPGTGRAL